MSHRPVYLYALLALLLSTLSVQNSAAGKLGRTQRSLGAALRPLADEDLSNKTWVEAFDALHTRMSLEYPFTDWKGINWRSLDAEFRPRIVAAQSRNDDRAYYLALREYVYSIPDGHVRVRGDDPKLMLAELIGGGYGLAVTGLDSGRVVAHIILPNGAAGKAGIRFGAEILKWNGQPIESALAQVPLWFDDKPPATRENQRLVQHRYLVRAPVGHKTTVTFKNPGRRNQRTVTLAATDDSLEILTRTNLYVTPEERKAPVEYEILPSGYGYIKVTTFPSPQFAPVFDQFKEAIQTFVNKKVPGVILDLRRNGGGDDAVTAKIAGFFYPNRQFYYAGAFYDPRSKEYEINPKEIFWIEPQLPHYGGKALAMISTGTVSNGEGLADAIRRLPQGYTVGFHGSNGAYGATGGQVRMPKGYIVLYPKGRGVDLDGNILLESNKEGVGGVAPDFRIPRTDKRIYAAFVEGRDVELESAIQILREHRKANE